MSGWKINEEKSISDNVVVLSDDICDTILSKIGVSNYKYSKINHMAFVEGEYYHDVRKVLKGIDYLKVKYIIYIFDNKAEYVVTKRFSSPSSEYVNYNCWSDYPSEQMMIVSAMVDGKILTDFAESVLHEVTHLYQYDQGMGKKVDLYDAVVKMVGRGGSRIANAVAMSVYYTFKHEQDAMVHQFYGYLMMDRPEGDFSSIVSEYEQYKDAINNLNIVKNNKSKASDYIYELGLTIAQWNQRVHYAYKRFYQKLYNAYVKYCYDTQIRVKGKSRSFESSDAPCNIVEFVRYDEKKLKYPMMKDVIESIYNYNR